MRNSCGRGCQAALTHRAHSAVTVAVTLLGAVYPGQMDDDEGFAGALIRLSLGVQYVHQDVSRSFDLTPQQAVLMFSLLEGPVGMAELSDRLHIEKSTLTGLVDRAERRCMVYRTPDR